MPLLEMQAITKSYGAFQALKGVDFTLEAGQVHALVGENGAGKSTLMKVLSGVERRDGGRMILAGRPITLSGVADARSHGIVMVYQELALVPSLSVAENLFLGDFPPVIRYRDLRARAAQRLREMDLDIDPAIEVERLSIGEQQLVEIAGALGRQGRILVLDEPTAALSAAESERLFQLIDRVQNSGVAIVYISHRLEEVFRIADQVTVLRDGALVGSVSVAEATPEQVVRMMVGRAVRTETQVSRRAADRSLGVFRFRADGLDQDEIRLAPGEVVGLAGVVGSGRSRVPAVLFGLEGRADWDGRPIRSPHDAISRGLVLVPSDRKTQGLVPDLPVRHNLTLAILNAVSRLGVLSSGRERHQARLWIERLSLRPPEPGKIVSELSGGNQQKVVVGKALATGPKVLLLDEPTRGVDIGARSELYTVIRSLAAQGIGILVSSSDTDELVGLADRILVFRKGRVTATLTAPMAQEEVVAHVTGAQ